MASTTILSDNGVSSGSAGIKTTGGNDGVLALQTTTSGGTATTAVTIDTSQNVGIGTSSPGYKLDVIGTVATTGTSGVGNIKVSGAGGTWFWIDNPTTSTMRFSSGGTPGTNPVTIDSSGNLLVGTTGWVADQNSMDGFSVLSSGAMAIARANAGVCVFNRRSSDGAAVYMQKNGTTVGTIAVTGSTTSYVTTSDYRLKENVQPMTGALSVVQQLKPVTYNWKVDGEATQGFIAHELQAVVPDCVVGEKDAVDAEGNPIYQGIDTSFLVATLTAAIQEQQALITTLTERIAALEAK